MHFSTVKYEALREELAEAYNLTVPLEGTVQAYGNSPTELRSSVFTPDHLQYMTALNTCPRAVGNLVYKPASLPSLVSLKCVLVDISCLTSVLEKAKSSPLIKSITNANQYCWDIGELQKILGELRLSRDNFEWLHFARGAAIVFRTAWSRFAPAGRVVSESWAPWHPYYLHPYLDKGAAHYLIDTLGVKGIGCDIYDLESPLAGLSIDRLINPNAEVVKAIRIAQSNANNDPEAGDLTTCVKDTAVSYDAWTAGHFHVPLSLFRHPTETKSPKVAGNMEFLYREGRLVMSFLSFGTKQTPVLASASFVPGTSGR